MPAQRRPLVPFRSPAGEQVAVVERVREVQLAELTGGGLRVQPVVPEADRQYVVLPASWVSGSLTFETSATSICGKEMGLA